MNKNVYRDERLIWTGGFFRCDACASYGTVSSGCEDCGEINCEACEGTGEVPLTCELRFDIDPGEPPTGMSGPPEYSDPGYGPEIHKINAFIEGKDVTGHLANIEDADEFICEMWEAPEPDYPDYPDPED